MNQEILQERFFETLINGDRPAARQIVHEAIRQGTDPEKIITELFWPTYELIERLFRSDQLTKLSHHLSVRLLRVLVDQTSQRLAKPELKGRTIFAFCGETECDELGAQMAMDLLESRGFNIKFAGGGVPKDEILAQVHEGKPDVLLMFCSAAADLPTIRELIDTIREIGACPNMQIIVGGGVFNRAEGLAEEIGADLSATHPLELVEIVATAPAKRAASDQRSAARPKRPAKPSAATESKLQMRDAA